MIYYSHKLTPLSLYSALFTPPSLLLIVFPTQLIYLINPSLTLPFTLLWFDFGQLLFYNQPVNSFYASSLYQAATAT